MEGAGGDNNIQENILRDFHNGGAQQEQDVANSLATLDFLGDENLLQRRLPTPPHEAVAASQPAERPGVQGIPQQLDFRQFGLLANLQDTQPVDFGGPTPQSALRGHLTTVLDPRLDQRRPSEADSWQAGVLRTESLLSHRHYDAAKRESCTDSSADVEYLLAGGFSLPHLRRTSSATTSHALAAGGLLAGGHRPGSTTGASALNMPPGGPQAHQLASLGSGVGPHAALHQQTQAPQQPNLPSSTQSMQPFQHIPQQQRLPVPVSGGVPSVQQRMRDTAHSDTFGSGSGMGASRLERWSEEGASMLDLSSGQASLSLPQQLRVDAMPTNQMRFAGAPATAAIAAAVPQAAERPPDSDMPMQHTALFATPFGSISPAVLRGEGQDPHDPDTDPRVTTGAAMVGGNPGYAGGVSSGVLRIRQNSPQLRRAETGPSYAAHDPFHLPLAPMPMLDTGSGGGIAEADDRHISASAFLEFANDSAVHFGGSSGLGAYARGGGDPPRSPVHLSVLAAMQASRQQLQQQQQRPLSRGSLSLQQLQQQQQHVMQPGPLPGPSGSQLLRPPPSSAVALQERLPQLRLSGAGTLGAGTSLQLPGGRPSSVGYRSPSLPTAVGVEALQAAIAGEGNRSPATASPRQAMQFPPLLNSLQPSIMLAPAQQQQFLHSLQPLQVHEQLQLASMRSHSDSPSRLRMMMQHEQQQAQPSSPYRLEGLMAQQQQQQHHSPHLSLPRAPSAQLPGQAQNPLRQQSDVLQLQQQLQQQAMTPFMQHLQQQASTVERRRAATSGKGGPPALQQQQQHPQDQPSPSQPAEDLRTDSGAPPALQQQQRGHPSLQVARPEGADPAIQLRGTGGPSLQAPGANPLHTTRAAQSQGGSAVQPVGGDAAAEAMTGPSDVSAAAVAAMARASRQMKRRRTSPQRSLKAVPSIRQSSQSVGLAPGSSQPSSAEPSRSRMAAVLSPVGSLQRRTTSLSGVGGGPVPVDFSGGAAAATAATVTATTTSARLFSESEGEEVQRRPRDEDDGDDEAEEGEEHPEDEDGGSQGDGSDGESPPGSATAAGSGEDPEVETEVTMYDRRRARAAATTAGRGGKGRRAAGQRAAAGPVAAKSTGIMATATTTTTATAAGAEAAAGGSMEVVDPVTGLLRRRAMTQEERMVRNREAAAKSRARRHQYQQSLEERILALQQHTAELRRLLEANAVPLPTHLMDQQASLGDGLPPPPPRTSPPRSRKGIGGRPRKYPLNPDGTKPSRKRRRTSTGPALTTGATPVPGGGGLEAEADGGGTDTTGAGATAAADATAVRDGGAAGVVAEEAAAPRGGRGGRGRRGRGGTPRGRGRGGGGSSTRRRTRQSDEVEDDAGSRPEIERQMAHGGTGNQAVVWGTEAVPRSSGGGAEASVKDSREALTQVLTAAGRVLRRQHQQRRLSQGALASAGVAGDPATHDSPVTQQPSPMTLQVQPNPYSPPPLLEQQVQQVRQQQQRPETSAVPPPIGILATQEAVATGDLGDVGSRGGTSVAAVPDPSQLPFAPWALPQPHQPPPLTTLGPMSAASGDTLGQQALSASVLDPQVASNSAATPPPLLLGGSVPQLSSLGSLSADGADELATGRDGSVEGIRPLGSPGAVAGGSAEGGPAGPGELGGFDMLGLGFGDLLGGFLGNQ